MFKLTPGVLSVALSLGSVLSFVLIGTNCGSTPAAPDPRVDILEEQVKSFIVPEAQEGFNELFKTKFAPEKSRLLIGADLDKWFQEHPDELKRVPADFREWIAGKRGTALFIEGSLPGKNGGMKDVVYMRPSRPGFRHFFWVVQPDPCGDGNPAMCDFCTGCSGETDIGTIHSCLCTQSCNDCHACTSCSH
jgi:hypothetical protein